MKNPHILYDKDADLWTIDEAIKGLNVQHVENCCLVHGPKSTWVKPIEAGREPYLCSSMRNLLLFFPGCIGVDEDNNRMFLSDINHHRIIISDGNGKILDCIGSSPGFEDGEFESSKLMRPAATFYRASEDCLYFVDSENHAIRRADFERRVVETIYPISRGGTSNRSLWRWIMEKIWTKRDELLDPEELDSKSLLFPWHLIKSSENDLFVLNRSFETLWILDLASGVVKEVIRGFPNVLEICGQDILEKSSLLKQIPSHWLQQFIDYNFSLEGIPYAGLVSSVAAFHDHVVICDTVGQVVVKFSSETGLVSSFQFSNFGILGLPYWLSYSMESVYSIGSGFWGARIAHIQHFRLLPGRIDIKLNVDIPKDTELVEALQEGCMWWQARGTAVEISGPERKVAASEKIGVAQQWYNELDSLASLTEDIELATEEEVASFDGNLQEERVCVDCAVNTSPGTCEVIIYAAVYLRLRRSANSGENLKQDQAARIANILDLTENGNIETDPFIQLMLKSKGDLRELIFVRPLHVRLKFNILDHPKAENSRDIILTDSSIEVRVALR